MNQGQTMNEGVMKVAEMVRAEMTSADDWAEATTRVAERLEADWRLSKQLLRAGLAIFAVRSAAGDVRRLCGMTGPGELAAFASGELPENWGSDSRTSMDPLVYMVPIPAGRATVNKLMGELTRSDLVAIAEFYDKVGRTMIEKGRRIREIAKAVAEGERLQDAYDRLSDEQKGFIAGWVNLPMIKEDAA